MKTVKQLKYILTRKKPELMEKYKVSRLGNFGSYVRQDNMPCSDVDILVELKKPIGLEFVSLVEELELLLGIKVDLVSANAVKPKMMNIIKKELLYIQERLVNSF